MHHPFSLSRRALLGGLLCAPATALAQGDARPGPPIQAVIPYPPGATMDRLGRAVLRALERVDGQTSEPISRAGSNGIIAGRLVAGAEPDGQTWLFSPDTLLTANPLLYTGRAAFDAERELVVAAPIGLMPALLVVHPSLGPKSVSEFVAYAQSNRVPYASGGVGSAGHLTMEWFGELANLKLRHVPYRGGAPAMVDVVSGQVPAAFVVAGNAIEAAQKGALLPLAVSVGYRLPALPDVPTMQDSGFPTFDVASACLLLLSARTPADVAAAVEARIRDVLPQPRLQDRMSSLGVLPMPLTLPETAVWLREQRLRWTRLIEANPAMTE